MGLFGRSSTPQPPSTGASRERRVSGSYARQPPQASELRSPFGSAYQPSGSYGATPLPPPHDQSRSRRGSLSGPGARPGLGGEIPRPSTTAPGASSRPRTSSFSGAPPGSVPGSSSGRRVDPFVPVVSEQPRRVNTSNGIRMTEQTLFHEDIPHSSRGGGGGGGDLVRGFTNITLRTVTESNGSVHFERIYKERRVDQDGKVHDKFRTTRAGLINDADSTGSLYRPDIAPGRSGASQANPPAYSSRYRSPSPAPSGSASYRSPSPASGYSSSGYASPPPQYTPAVATRQRRTSFSGGPPPFASPPSSTGAAPARPPSRGYRR